MMPSQPLRAVSAAERETYVRDGVVCLRRIFPVQWIEFVAAAMIVHGAPGNAGSHRRRALATR